MRPASVFWRRNKSAIFRTTANFILLPTKPIGDNSSMPDSNGRLRFGVVGTGAFGLNHARVYRDLQADAQLNVQLVGVADTDVTRARTVASEFGTQAFGSVGELLAAGVDAVSVAVPT